MKNVIAKAKERVAKVKEYVNAKKFLVAAYLMSVMSDLSMMTAYADDPAPATAEQKWQDVMDFILPWIQRLGGVVILIGAVEFGLAFKNDDAEGKTKGIRTVIAGCIVFAVGLSADVFLV